MYAILLAVLPAAGKSHMARKLSGLLGLPVFSKDDIKERLYDTVGFHSRAEKVALGVGAMEILYYTAGQVMGQGGSVIIENNFENASVPGLRALLEKHGAQPITVMLTGDYQIIYQRFLLRDQSPQRHRGHIVNTCYPEPEGAKALYQPMSLEQFVAGFTSRGMAGFDIVGPRITVDMTEVGRIDYQQLAGEIKALMTSWLPYVLRES